MGTASSVDDPQEAALLFDHTSEWFKDTEHALTKAVADMLARTTEDARKSGAFSTPGVTAADVAARFTRVSVPAEGALPLSLLGRSDAAARIVREYLDSLEADAVRDELRLRSPRPCGRTAMGCTGCYVRAPTPHSGCCSGCCSSCRRSAGPWRWGGLSQQKDETVGFYI